MLLKIISFSFAFVIYLQLVLVVMLHVIFIHHLAMWFFATYFSHLLAYYMHLSCVVLSNDFSHVYQGRANRIANAHSPSKSSVAKNSEKDQTLV